MRRRDDLRHPSRIGVGRALPSISACWIAVTGRQKLYRYFESQHPTNASDIVTVTCAKNRDDSAYVVREMLVHRQLSQVPVDLHLRVDRAVEQPDLLLLGAPRVRQVRRGTEGLHLVEILRPLRAVEGRRGSARN